MKKLAPIVSRIFEPMIVFSGLLVAGALHAGLGGTTLVVPGMVWMASVADFFRNSSRFVGAGCGKKSHNWSSDRRDCILNGTS